MAMATIAIPDLSKHLKHLGSGKVREIYELNENELLFIATDRISAYDVIMRNGIAGKGEILTQLSHFWFRLLQSSHLATTKIANLTTHFQSLGVPESLRKVLPAETFAQLDRRSMVVRKLKPLPIESIVRGYITGSAWSSYTQNGTVCGIPLPAGLEESEKFPQALWTPSTKAEQGDKDENISPEEAEQILGKDIAAQVKSLSLAIYEKARTYAAEKGIIIADTKFEFGLDESTSPPTVVLIDEVLTPDSSRFWPADKYAVGRGQESFDKQFLRDWLVRSSLKGKEDVTVPDDVVGMTVTRYTDAYTILTGTLWK